MRREVLLMLAVLAAPGPALADGDPSVDLVAFDGPAAPSNAAAAARDRVAARARDAHRAWIDLSPAAPAPPAAPTALRDGIDAYDELRWDAARAALDAAADDAARTGGAGLAAAELSDVFLYRGLVYTQRGDATRAWDDLVRAATLAPARTLDPLRFPTRAVEAFDRARAAVGARPRARLAVDATGCDAWIDGAVATTATVAQGDHFVRVACRGRAAWGARVTVTADATIAPPADEAPPPDDAAIGALVVRRGAAAALVVVVAEDGRAVTAALRVVDAHGRASRRSSVTLDGERGLAALDDAVARALRASRGAVAAKRRWYRSPWLWAAVGAAATAAIVIPLTAGGDGGPDTATLRPIGLPW